MAYFRFEGLEEYGQMINRQGHLYGPMCRAMLDRATKIVAESLKAANSVFAKHVRPIKAKRNKYGWYAQVRFGGKKYNRSETGSGTSAARAATIYEYGRTGATYTDDYGNIRSFPDQPARPFIRAATKKCEPEVIAAMEEEMDRILKENGSEELKTEQRKRWYY